PPPFQRRAPAAPTHDVGLRKHRARRRLLRGESLAWPSLLLRRDAPPRTSSPPKTLHACLDGRCPASHRCSTSSSHRGRSEMRPRRSPAHSVRRTQVSDPAARVPRARLRAPPPAADQALRSVVARAKLEPALHRAPERENLRPRRQRPRARAPSQKTADLRESACHDDCEATTAPANRYAWPCNECRRRRRHSPAGCTFEISRSVLRLVASRRLDADTNDQARGGLQGGAVEMED